MNRISISLGPLDAAELKKGAVPSKALYLSSVKSDESDDSDEHENLSSQLDTANNAKKEVFDNKTDELPSDDAETTGEAPLGDDAELNSDDDLSDYTSMYTEETPAKAEGKIAEESTPATTVTSSGLHEGFRCNSCSGDIVGFRYTCVECVDCDFCALCEVRGTHALHYVLRVPGPRPHTEVRAMVDRIRREVLSVLQPPEVDDADSVKVEVKMEADPGPDPLLVAAASTCTSAALSEPQVDTPILDAAVQDFKVEVESDDETAMDIGDTDVMSQTGQVVHDELEAVVPKKSSARQKTPSARQKMTSARQSMSLAMQKKTSATKTRARKRPAAPTREQAQKKLLLEIDSQVRQATTSAMEDTGGSSCEVFTHSKGGEVAAPSLGGGERTTPSSPGKEETSAVTRRRIL